MRFEFPFILIGKSTMAFFNPANHGAYSIPDTRVGAKKQGFRRCFPDGLNQSLVSSVAQAFM